MFLTIGGLGLTALGAYGIDLARIPGGLSDPIGGLMIGMGGSIAGTLASIGAIVLGVAAWHLRAPLVTVPSD
jgi:hypothetical protein